MTRCPHVAPPLVACAYCVQRLLEPPPVKKSPEHRGRKGPRRPTAWVARLPGGKARTYEGVSLSTARHALRHELGKRAPAGTVWEARR